MTRANDAAFAALTEESARTGDTDFWAGVPVPPRVCGERCN